MFQNVDNLGGRADCQDDFETFYIMRRSQYDNWTEEMVRVYGDFAAKSLKDCLLYTSYKIAITGTIRSMTLVTLEKPPAITSTTNIAMITPEIFSSTPMITNWAVPDNA